MRRYVADIYLDKHRTQVTVEARDPFEAERMIRAQYNVTGKILVSPDFKYEHAVRDEENRRKWDKAKDNNQYSNQNEPNFLEVIFYQIIGWSLILFVASYFLPASINQNKNTESKSLQQPQDTENGSDYQHKIPEDNDITSKPKHKHKQKNHIKDHDQTTANSWETTPKEMPDPCLSDPLCQKGMIRKKQRDNCLASGGDPTNCFLQ